MFFKIIFSLLFFATNLIASELPSDGVVNIWPAIPFVRGADLCSYQNAYGETRNQYMQTMIKNATELMTYGSFGYEALALLTEFNNTYDNNIRIAGQNQYLDVTLEATFKAYLDGYYRDLRPRTKKIIFNNRDGKLSDETLSKLDYFAFGTYSYAPNCQGDILVTVQLLGRNGETKSYLGHGIPRVVMSQIASQIFTDFQRTQFPSTIQLGNKSLTLIGGLNGSVDRAASTEIAVQSCEVLGARLPTQFELEILNGFGDWSGGVSLNNEVWALGAGIVYAPLLKNPTPVRSTDEVNETEFLYYCVK